MHLPGCILDTPRYMVTYASMWVRISTVFFFFDGEFSPVIIASSILPYRFYINLDGYMYILIDTSTWIYI